MFLKTVNPPDAVGPIERMLNDHEHAGIFVRPGDLLGKAGRAPQPGMPVPPEASRLRTKLWDLSAMLHCSVIGTCLTIGELRSLVRKSEGVDAEKASDHDLHHIAVAAAGTRDELSKEINKALDRRHRLAITRFRKAACAKDLHGYWDEAVRDGDIPGAYWALLTHPLATDDTARHAFGDLHMLSHLVGAANRADIRRLRKLEEEKAGLEEKLARQQRRLRDDIVSRDAKIRELGEALAASIAGRQSSASAGETTSAFDHLLTDLRKQLDLEIRRRERAEEKARELTETTAAEKRQISTMKQELAALKEELCAAESALATLHGEDKEHSPDGVNLSGLTVLYVGGRPHQVARLRSVLERASASLIHHDGGIEQKGDLLPGLVNRADLAVFPVDCISHDAALSVKRLCRQAGKPFVPLRSNGLASFLSGVRSHFLPASAQPS